MFRCLPILPILMFCVSAVSAQDIPTFHFQTGDDPNDPDTSARVGLSYLKGALIRAGGHIGLALAGYNGGYGVMAAGWGAWAAQTQNYYRWGSGIYLDALYGRATSPTLQSWLNAGGSILCAQAAARQSGTLQPFPSLPPSP